MDRLEILAQSYKTSPAVCLLSVWQVLAWRLTGRSDFILGSYVDGRNYEELQDALGLFAKYLPLRCQLDAGSSFESVVERVEAATHTLYKWQECFSLEQLRGAAEDDDWANKSAASGQPFANLYFEWREQPVRRVFSDLSFSILKQSVRHDRFNLKLTLVRSDEGLLAELTFDGSLYEDDDIQRLAGQFQTLLESVLDGPGISIDRLEILSRAEQRQLLFAFNETGAVYEERTLRSPLVRGAS